MSSPPSIRCHDEAPSAVALDDGMMHRSHHPRASPRRNATRLVLEAEVLDRVGTMLSTSFDAGVPLRDVQEAASHADPRTTIRYDRARASLDRHATCVVAAYVAGAAR